MIDTPATSASFLLKIWRNKFNNCEKIKSENQKVLFIYIV